MESDTSAPEAHHFDSSTGGVMSIVEDLGAKFEDQRDEVEKQERLDQHAFNLLSQDLTDQIESATRNRAKKAAFKAQREQESADMSGELADAQATLKEDQKYLSDLTAEWEQKTADFEQRQETRQGEIEALKKAIEIMSTADVAGGAQHLPGLVQTRAVPALAQLRSSSHSPTQDAAAVFLRERAGNTNSRMLSGRGKDPGRALQ